MPSRSSILSALPVLLLFGILGARAVEHRKGWLLDLPVGASVTAESEEVVDLSAEGGLLRGQVYTFPSSRFASVSDQFAFFESRLALRGETRAFSLGDWQGFRFDGTAGRDKATGWMWAAFLRHPTKGAFALNLMATTNRKASLDDLALSILDGFAPDRETSLYPGPAALTTDGRSKVRLSRTVSFGGEMIDAGFEPAWISSSRAVCDRETRLLFKITNDNWGAMTRFYRIVGRASRGGLEKFAQGLRSYFAQQGYDDARKVGFLNQSMYLIRTLPLNKERILATPFEVLDNAEGDCDSKSLCLALLLEALGLEGEMIVSLKDEHALIGLPPRYFIEPQQIFVYSTKGKPLVGLDLLQDPRTNFFVPSNWKPVALRYEN